MTKLLDAHWWRSVQLFHKAPNFSLNREYDIDIENCPPEELENKALQKFYVEVCNFVMPIINK